ncbi:MAG: outer membrane lipoprotein-sorting protein, partial [Gammaproteobacteria bacterium]|nr:outer membrane lipoprotein-sorting protein [Gammaproteobacteria bacterium]
MHAPVSRYKNRKLNPCLAALLVALAPLAASAQSPAEKGLAIALEADRRDLGFNDFEANMTMLLKNKQGDESLRNIRIRTLEVAGDGDKSLSIFDRPADVKGTAFLTHSHTTKPDDQWIYLPALKRVKRISSKNKSGPFMGSEFAYEDIASQEIDKYTYKYLRDEDIDGRKAFVVEQYPTYKYSGYKRRIVWIDQERYIPLRVEFYDRKDALLKTLKMSDYRQYLKQYWRAGKMYMENHQTGKTTLLTWSD